MKASTKRIATVGMSVLLTFAMAPMQAFAASSVTVGGNSYDKASSGSGSAGGAWAWDGANGMTLDNYDGGSISAVGDLAIALTGDNKVDAGDEDYGITTTDGDLSITGDGNLDVKVDSDTSADGIFAENGDITISDTSVSVDATSDGRVSGVHAHNGDVNVEGSTVSVNTTSDSGTSSGIVGASGDVNVDNSNVTVSNSGAVNGSASSLTAAASTSSAARWT